jgi:hypothetical protein
MGFPQIGTDWSRGKNGGMLYVAWSDYRNGDRRVRSILIRFRPFLV